MKYVLFKKLPEFLTAKKLLRLVERFEVQVHDK
jgi:hypothetical protein